MKRRYSSAQIGWTSAAARPYKRPRVVRRAPIQRKPMILYKRPRGELKGVDTALTGSTWLNISNTNGLCDVLNLVQEGNGSYNRIGRKIKLRSLRIRGTVKATLAEEAVTGNFYGITGRMVVVWDKSPNGASIPTFDTIFGYTEQDGTEVGVNEFAPLRYDNTSRFSVVRDKCFVLNPVGDNNSGGAQDRMNVSMYIDEFINLKNRETSFNSTANPMTIANISTGALYIYYRADYNTANTTTLNLSNGIARLRYTDS